MTQEKLDAHREANARAYDELVNEDTSEVMESEVKITIGGTPIKLKGLPKSFKTGSIGYFINGKTFDANGDKYQVSCNIVKCGSKPKTETA